MENKISNKYLFKFLYRTRQKSKYSFLKIFNLDDLAVFILSLFFVSGIVFSAIDNFLIEIAKFNLLTISFITLFVVQKNNFLELGIKKDSFLEQFPISIKKIKRFDLLILFLYIFKSIFIFQIVFVVFLAIKISPMILVLWFPSLLFMTSFCSFFSESIKLIILFVGKYFYFVYKVKISIMLMIFSILYYLISKYQNNIFNLFYSPFNVNNFFYNLFLTNKYNYIDLILFFGYVFIFILTVFLIFPLITIDFNKKTKEKKIKDYKNKTYQKETISRIVDSMLRGDLETNSYYLDSIMSAITTFIWICIIFYSTPVFKNFGDVVLIASIISLFRSGTGLTSFLYSNEVDSLDYFEIFEEFSYKKIYDIGLRKIFKIEFLFLFTPIVLINIYFFYEYLYLIIPLLVLVLISSFYLNYRFVVKFKPFSKSRYSYDPVVDNLSTLITLIIMIYLMIVFPLIGFKWYIILPLIIFFSIFLIPFLMVSFKAKFKYKYVNFKQKSDNDCGLYAIKTFLANNSISLDTDFIDIDKYEEGLSFEDMIQVAAKKGLKLSAYYVFDINQIKNKMFIAQTIKNDVGHFVVVFEAQDSKVILGDPNYKNSREVSRKNFEKIFTGNILILE